MKKILLIFFFILLIVNSAMAQSKRSTIQFRLSDGGLMNIAINDRYFNKTGARLTIGNIPGKWQEIKVYRYHPYANRRGGKAELVFRGDIKIKKGSKYEAIIDPKTGQLYLTQVNAFNENKGKLPAPEKNQPLSEEAANQNSTESELAASNNARSSNDTTTINTQLSVPMLHLQKQMYAVVSDRKKLGIAIDYLKQITTISSEDVRYICSWLLFDDNRIKFLKVAFEKVSDAQNLEIIKSTFTEAAAKEELESFLQSK